MPYVKFKYDAFEDGENILRVLTTSPQYDIENAARSLKGLDSILIEKVQTEKDYLIKQQLIAEHLSKYIPNNQKLISTKIQSFQEAWDKINEIYFQRLAKLLNIQIPKNNIYTAYLTQGGSCPFNVSERWFMVRLADEKVDVIAAHEIMHIEFIRAYGLYCKNKELPSEQFGILKEGLTVLLNEEMGDILSRLDYGYPEHQDLRNKILTLWRKNKNFKDLLEKMIRFLK